MSTLTPADGHAPGEESLLATVPELRALPGLGTLPEVTALVLLEAATAVVQAYVGQHLLYVEDDVLEIGLDHEHASSWLYLPEQPVLKVHEIRIDERPITEVRVQLAHARIWRHGGWHAASPRWCDQPSKVTVVYDHGNPPGHQALRLAKAAVLMLASASAREDGEVRSESIGDYAVTYADVASSMTTSLDGNGMLGLALRRKYARTRFTSIRVTRG